MFILVITKKKKKREKQETPKKVNRELDINIVIIKYIERGFTSTSQALHSRNSNTTSSRR